jgi:hypothetical protein
LDEMAGILPSFAPIGLDFQQDAFQRGFAGQN